jgi:hypothetical protein
MMPQSPLRIKEGGKFYERLLTKETTGANRSFRYYWAEPGSVPFVWESQPGTPRDSSRMDGGSLPAITPPPSYLLRHGGVKVQVTAPHHPKRKVTLKKRYRFKRIKIGFISDIFRRLTVGKAWWRPEPSSAQVSSSSRWLVATPKAEQKDRQHQQGHHDHDLAAKKSGAVCSVARQMSPCWMMRIRGTGNQNYRDCD